MMLFSFNFIFPALVLCIIIAIMFSYLGFHVVKRGVIFVDLALAQIAALGTTIAVFMGWDETHPFWADLLSLSFATFGALLFAYFRKTQKIINIEALIGITYAGAIALSLLILEKTATGTEHVKEMLVGAIFTVSWKSILVIAIIFGIVGIIQIVFRDKFFRMSNLTDGNEPHRTKALFWDFLFYFTFAVAVTFAVKIAGVLLVFSLLIIPSVTARFFSENSKINLLFGSVFGVIGCVAGLELSVRADLTAATSIVLSLLVLLAITVSTRALTDSSTKLKRK